MRAIDTIRWALKLTEEGTAALVNDMRDAPLTPSTPGAKGGEGNHPLWCLGHQAYLEAGIPKILFGPPKENPLQSWAPLFAAGTTPTSDASDYPPFDDVLRTYREVRASTLSLLEEIGDADLDRRPKAVPRGFEDAMQTFGQTILLLALHNMVHYGQITDARRVAGRRPRL